MSVIISSIKLNFRFFFKMDIKKYINISSETIKITNHFSKIKKLLN